MIKTHDRISLIRTLIDAHDDNHIIARAIMINNARDADATRAELRDDFILDDFDALHALIAPLFTPRRFDDDIITARSELAIDDFSLCPLHFIDYAICFDDDDDACAAIRACFPSHDT
jgi:hypothetical protein